MLYYVLYAALSVWALIDAARQRVAPWWFLVILFVPLGAVFYFVATRLAAPVARPGPAWSEPARRISLEELRRRVDRVPSVLNLLDLGEGLLARGEHEEARRTFADVVARDADSDRAAFGLAAALHALGRPEEAAAAVAPLVERQPAARNYEAWTLYADALVRAGRREEGLASMREMARVSGGLRQRLAYARLLAEEEGRAAAAADELRQALEEFEFAPRFVKQRDRSVVREVRRELARLEARA